MEFNHADPPARFSVPDKITIRQQMAYFSAGIDAPVLERLWIAAIPLISDWQCEIFPDHKASLDEATDPRITQVLSWAGLRVKQHIDAMGLIEKNS
jgi:hypothetical protein